MYHNFLTSRYDRLKFLEVVDGLLSDLVRDIRPIDKKHSAIVSIHSLGVSREMDLRVIEAEVRGAQANKLIGNPSNSPAQKQNSRKRISRRSLASRQQQVKAEVYRQLTTNYHAQNALVILWASSVDRWEARLVLTKISTHKGRAKKIYTYSLYGGGLILGPELVGNPSRLRSIRHDLLARGAIDNLHDLASRFGYRHPAEKRFSRKDRERVKAGAPSKLKRRKSRRLSRAPGQLSFTLLENVEPDAMGIATPIAAVAMVNKPNNRPDSDVRPTQANGPPSSGQEAGNNSQKGTLASVVAPRSNPHKTRDDNPNHYNPTSHENSTDEFGAPRDNEVEPGGITVLGDSHLDIVHLYLEDVGTRPLLTADEEKELAHRVKDGDPGARNEMASSNLRLVVSIAKKYAGRGVELLDLIQSGNRGLLRAVDKFDPSKDFKFSTYATYWVRQAITRDITNHSRTIRIPSHVHEVISKVMRTRHRLAREYNRKPTHEEIAVEMEVEPDRIESIIKINQTPNSLEQILLEAQNEEDESEQIKSPIVDTGDIWDPYDTTLNNPAVSRLLRDRIKVVLAKCLLERERWVIERRFGLNDGQVRTLEDVGQELRVTRERIRQIEAKALNKLRRHKDVASLYDYLAT